MRFAPLVVTVAVAGCAEKKTDTATQPWTAKQTASPMKARAADVMPGTFTTQCWSLSKLQDCTSRTCPGGKADCCDDQTLGCMARECASHCDYHVAFSEQCQCQPGTCDGGSSVCACTTDDGGAVIGAQWTDCPNAFPNEYPACDAKRRRCVCQQGANQHCAGSTGYWMCNGDGSWVSMPCPADTSTCHANSRTSFTKQCTCLADCANRQCGDDGCGKSCGPCNPPLFCNAAWRCENCVPVDGHCRESKECCGYGELVGATCNPNTHTCSVPPAPKPGPN